MSKKIKGFTLLEFLIVIVIIAVLAAIVFPRYFGQVHRAKEAEAVQSLGAIRSAELTLQGISGQFVAAADELGIKSFLGLTIGGGAYRYKVIDATAENFLAVATPLDLLDNWLQEIAVNKDGFVGYSPAGGGFAGGSSGDSGGGSSGGGSSEGGSGSGSTGSSGSASAGYSTGGGTVTTAIVSPVATYSTLTEATYLDASLEAPTGLQLTANDGWLVLNFAGNSNAGGYQIYRRENTPIPEGQTATYENLAPTTVWRGSTWADGVDNSKKYCYAVKSLKQNTSTGGWTESEMSQEVCGQAAPNTDYENKSTDAITTLTGKSESFSAALEPPVASSDPARTPSTWNDVVTFLGLNNIPVLFGNMYDITGATGGKETTLGEYNPITHAIILNSKYANAPKEMIASVIAHEGLHAMWDADWDSGAKLFGRPPDTWVRPAAFVDPRSQNSTKQEYNSFVGGFQVWNALKNSVPEGSMDSTTIALWNSWVATEAAFFSEGGDPVAFTDTSVTQFFSSLSAYSELLDY